MVRKLDNAKDIGDEGGESGRQVQRYIRLTELIPELLELVDDERMAFRPAVEISYIRAFKNFWILLDTSRRPRPYSHPQRNKKNHEDTRGRPGADNIDIHIAVCVCFDGFVQENRTGLKKTTHIKCTTAVPFGLAVVDFANTRNLCPNILSLPYNSVKLKCFRRETDFPDMPSIAQSASGVSLFSFRFSAIIFPPI